MAMMEEVFELHCFIQQSSLISYSHSKEIKDNPEPRKIFHSIFKEKDVNRPFFLPNCFELWFCWGILQNWGSKERKSPGLNHQRRNDFLIQICWLHLIRSLKFLSKKSIEIFSQFFPHRKHFYLSGKLDYFDWYRVWNKMAKGW